MSRRVLAAGLRVNQNHRTREEDGAARSAPFNHARSDMESRLRDTITPKVELHSMQRRRVTRIVLLALVLATGGAIVNVAVAWGCLYMFPPLHQHHGRADSERELSNEEGARILRSIFPGEPIGDDVYGVIEVRPGWSEIHTAWSLAIDVDGYVCEIKRAGWPMKGLSGYWRWDERTPDFEYCGAFKVPDWAIPKQGNRRLISFVPYGPIWPGFAINTVFYAAVLWLLFTFPFALRRRRRLKRGLCPACAYPVGTGPVCTECGKPVTLRSVEPS